MVSFSDCFRGVLPEDQIEENVMMSERTTFRCGGPARLILTIKSEAEAERVFRIISENRLPYAFLGRGSNYLVSDRGYDGILLTLHSGMDAIEVRGTEIFAEAGAMLSRVAAAAEANALSGFSFSAGIPGTVGGGVFMNAGAYDGEIKDRLKSVRVLEKSGNVAAKKTEELDLSYRHSVFMENGELILSAIFSGIPGNPAEIREKTEEFQRRRSEKQPLEFPSAGSTFKRPQGYFAGKLIGDSGLSGYRIGGAEVSEKHNGFIINRDHASAEEIYDLIRYVQNRVYESQGVRLTPEVRFLGEF